MWVTLHSSLSEIKPKLSIMPSLFKCIFILLAFSSFHCCQARIFSFKMHHRFSEPVKKWSQTAGKLFPAVDWPEKGSVEYYAELAKRDRILHGRRLSDIEKPLAFSNGNSTFQINSLGFLHYTTVELGTPAMKFLVALDTGSDLFWVPCDCSRCAPTEGTAYTSDFELSVYNPKGSSTSKNVTCSNSLCAHRNQCIGSFSNCPYMVSYVSAETSTSGVLVEDVLHLTKEGSHQELIEAYITFGCGQVQTGSFLDIAAPNGLFGLGMEKISVPSILSKAGFTADSFSMCFGHDGIGRISFGDKGIPDQDETPFNLNPSHPTYNVTATQIRIGMTIIDVDFTALFDSGTSFTYLVEPMYTMLSKSFHSQVQDKRRPPDTRIPFEYCYDMSPDENASLIPSMSFSMKGGSRFAVYDPIIVISSQSVLVYCLAVVKSSELNIIGQNFMTGYRVIFDREKLVLGWKKFNCYDVDEPSTYQIEPQASTVPPAVAVGLGNYTRTNSTKKTRKKSESSVASPSCHSHASNLMHKILFLLIFLLLWPFHEHPYFSLEL